MKINKLYTIVLLLSILTLNIFAQPSTEEKMELLVENCYKALEHENSGVKESAIFISIQFKSKFPNEDVDKFIDALDDLASNSNNPRVSYKAQLAKIFISNYDWFKDMNISSIEFEQEVYEEIAEKLSNKLFAAEF